jgi:hypothetical protein
MEIITQADAKARGFKRYFDGTRCTRGHIAEKYVRGRGCVECARTRQRVPASRKATPAVAPAVDAAPPAYEPEKTLHKDPGNRISQARIDAFIDRIYAGPRLGTAPALAEGEAA